VVDGCRAVLGDGHPFLPAYRASLAIALRRLGEVQLATEIDAAAQAGVQHAYHALCCAVGRAADLHLLGERKAAAELSGATLARFQARLGPRHPYTLACAHDHEVISGAPSGLDPIGGLAALLGADHPDVAAATQGELLECPIEPTPL
jgi:hypothetical protein